MKENYKKYATLILLGFAGGAIFMLPYIKFIFYNPMMDVMGITNAQSGTLLSMYAIGNIVLYIPGGMIADRISPRISITVSLLATTVFTIIFALTFHYYIALGLWLLMSFGSGFVFWAAILKTIRMIGTKEEQGRMYGIYYAANGGFSALIGAVCLKAFSMSENERTGLFWATMLMGFFTLLAAVLLFIVLKGNKNLEQIEESEEKFRLKDLKKTLTTPSVWLISIICFCVYGVYSCASFFTPYLTDVVGYSATQAGAFELVRGYVVMLFAAPLGGYLADKVFHSTLKWFMVGGTFLGVSILTVMLIGTNGNNTLIAISTLLPGLFSMTLYGIMFSSMQEVNIPIKMAGTAIGIASIIGYMPDLFLQTFFGAILDSYGKEGYSIIFFMLAIFCIITVFASWYLYNSCNKKMLSTHMEIEREGL